MIQYYTIKEFAAQIGVHPITVRRGIAFGRIHAFKVGTGKRSSYRILKSELERMAAFDLTNLVEERANEKIRVKDDI